jgi:hypothetical protein
MKKITLTFFAIFALYGSIVSQTNITVDAPQYNGDFSAFVGPNTTAATAYHRACYLITQSELTRMINTNSVVTSFGFDFYRPANVAVAGQFTLYLQNTSDATYLKGTSYTALLAGMSTNYNGNIIIPTGSQNATATVSMPLSNTFTYTGGGVYVAFDWYCATPTATTFARYLTNGNSTSFGVNSAAPIAGPAPTTLTVDVRRPAMRFGTINTATNEIAVTGIKALGLVSKRITPPSPVVAQIRNNSINTINNVTVNLNVTGANPFNNNQVVSSIAPGASMNVVFSSFTSTVNGFNSMTVSVAADQYTVNNQSAWTQSVNCTNMANNPPFAASAYSLAAYGYGGQAIIATPLNPIGNINITGIAAAPSASPGASYSLCGVLLDSGGTIIATTNTVFLSAANYGTFSNLKFPAPEPLTGGTNYYIGIAQLTGNCFPFGTRPMVLATNDLNLYYNVPISGGSIGGVQNQMGYIGIHALLSYSNTELEALASKTLICKGNTTTLSVNGSATTYTWNGPNSSAIISSTVGVADVTPIITPTAGAVNYTVNGTDGSTGCRTNAAIITISISACTGLSSYGIENYDINIFPNPANNGRTSIGGLQGVNTILLYNAIGKIVSTLNTSEETAIIDFESLAKGSYIIKITGSNNQTKVVKFIN